MYVRKIIFEYVSEWNGSASYSSLASDINGAGAWPYNSRSSGYCFYLFIYGLFNDDGGSSVYVASKV
jgi:hypothetical protein